MNKFEQRIVREYSKCVIDLVKDATQTAADFSDVTSPAAVYQNEMQIAAMYRVTFLAVKEYHQILSQHLASKGIVLPDFDELVSSL